MSESVKNNAEEVPDALRSLLVERILASVQFRRSPKLSAFLSYICEQERIGNIDCINEQHIGVHVFGRTVGYHVGEDSIVRSQARFLRQRLEAYFACAESSESILLTIPKGSYVPLFQWNESPVAATQIATETPVPALEASATNLTAEVSREARSQQLRWISSVAAVLCLLAIATFLHYHSGTTLQAKETAEARFWASLFDKKRSQIIVPSDSSLVLLEDMRGKDVPLTDYMSRKYLADPEPAGGGRIWHSIAHSQYTNMADLNLVSRLEQRFQVQQSQVQIRFARDLTLKELKNSNAILIGGPRSNPWVALFLPHMRFRVDFDQQIRQNYVENQQSESGVAERYYELGYKGQHTAYGVIGYVPSLDGQGSTLLVGGTSKAGTEAAAEFLFSSEFASFLRNFDTQHALPHFEIMLSAQNINGDSQDGKIVKFHRLN